MDFPGLEQVLAELPHFRTLDAELVEQIARGSRRRVYARDETILRQGEPCRAFFFIEQGAARLYRPTPEDRTQVLHLLRAGRSFAEAALLSLHGYPVDGAAMEASTWLIEVGLGLSPGDRATESGPRDGCEGEACGRLLFGSGGWATQRSAARVA